MCIDKLLTYHLEHVQLAQENRIRPKSAEILRRMLAHLTESQPVKKLLRQCLLQLLDLSINFEQVVWLVSKPILPLVFCVGDDVWPVLNVLVSSQMEVDRAKGERLQTLCRGLIEGVDNNLEPSNRKVFSANLALFRFVSFCAWSIF